MKIGRQVDRMWIGVFIATTVFIMVWLMGAIAPFVGLTPVLTFGFDMAALDVYGVLQLVAVFLLIGMSVAYLRKNTSVMKKM